MNNEQQLYNNTRASRRGRKSESCNVRLRPIFREEPDIEKLGRAIIAMAMRAADMEMGAKTGESDAIQD